MPETSSKNQKLASAVYFITSFFSDLEPTKWKLRTLAVDLVSERIKDQSVLAQEMISIFTLAQTAGLISEANHLILIKELSRLERESEKTLHQIFLSGGVSDERSLLQSAKTDYIKDRNVAKEDIFEKRELLDSPAHKPLKEFGAVSVKKNTRQSIIIGLLKRKKEIMIKDVSPLIEGCSEKTIQRELLTMVADGILRKIGEKRWSRYTLASLA